MVTLEEAKNYLRVEHSEDDELIQSLLAFSEAITASDGPRLRTLIDESFARLREPAR